uniref:KASH domain-containing protein n=1 Tax=Pundamilia nyererei TaxID=303518 RepID=A0A3B4FK85_9CICH
MDLDAVSAPSPPPVVRFREFLFNQSCLLCSYSAAFFQLRSILNDEFALQTNNSTVTLFSGFLFSLKTSHFVHISARLERRWLLWHEFMKEYDHLDAWLRLAEEAVSSPNSVHVTYQTAKEEMKKFERLRREAGPRLIQLDSLTRRNRTLTRLFQGTMQARLLSSARECGRRWDDVSAKLQSITGQLQVQWEAFDAQREELAVWLADMDVRLIEVEQLTGNACEKLRQLQPVFVAFGLLIVLFALSSWLFCSDPDAAWPRGLSACLCLSHTVIDVQIQRLSKNVPHQRLSAV